MQYFSYILIIVLKYGKILIKAISTQYLLNKKGYPNCCHIRSLDDTSRIFRQLDILTIYDIIDFNTFISMHNVFYKLVPLTLQSMFPMSSSKKYKNNFYVIVVKQEESNFQ